MTNKISTQAAHALRAGRRFSSSNTTVIVSSVSTPNSQSWKTTLLLHGHEIAEFSSSTGILALRDAGWQTVTTKTRLNAVLEEFQYPYRIRQRKSQWFIVAEGKSWPWSGELDLTVYHHQR